ncbi:MAG: nucleotide pyrophosphohydrolase [Pseudomonadota bacterium]
MTSELLDLTELKEKLRQFAQEREWEIYHNPKNLSMALTVESAELMEIFQWLTAEETQELSVENKHKVSEELADILLYTIRLADRLNISLSQAAQEKLIKNAKKYPVEKARGNAKKYHDL